MYKYNSLINFAVVSIAALVGLFLILTRVDSYLKLRSIEECGKIAKYEKTIDNTKITAPLADVYKSCLKDKGY